MAVYIPLKFMRAVVQQFSMGSKILNCWQGGSTKGTKNKKISFIALYIYYLSRLSWLVCVKIKKS